MISYRWMSGQWPSLAAVLLLVLSACAPAAPPPDTPGTATAQPEEPTREAGPDQPSRCAHSAVENLGSELNSPVFDGSPTVSADDRTLFFTSNRVDGQEDLFVSTRQAREDPWGQAESLGSPVNHPTADDNALRLSRDGRSLYFSSQRPGGLGSSDLYVALRQSPADPWGPPANLGALINTAAFEAFPTPSADGNTLYFNRSTTFDSPDSDIWMTTRSSENEPWGEPERLPEPINVAGMDLSPATSADGLMLYFASQRPGNIGLLDLWVATRSNVNEAWGEPENLGPDINAEQSFTLAPFVSGDGQSLYFMSTRPGGLGGPNCSFFDCFDLYVARRKCT